MPERPSVWLRDIHDRYARVILAAIATLMVPLMVLTTVATLDNWRQDNDRDAIIAEQDRLLACFDEFAAASTVTSVAVREASVKKDIRTAEAWTALNAEGEAFLVLTRGILKRDVTPEQFKALKDSLADRARAGRKLERAQAALDKARRENPIPPPPSEFCSTD